MATIDSVTKAGTWNSEVAQGEDWVRSVQFFQADGTTPLDLTGCTAKSEWRAEQSKTSALLATAACTIVGNTITMRVESEITYAIAQRTVFHDLFIIDIHGDQRPVLRGSHTVIKAVTNTDD